jgi:hypothetical protein
MNGLLWSSKRLPSTILVDDIHENDPKVHYHYQGNVLNVYTERSGLHDFLNLSLFAEL